MAKDRYFTMMTENVRFLSIHEDGRVEISTCVQNFSLDDGPDIRVDNVIRIEVTSDFTNMVMKGSDT